MIHSQLHREFDEYLKNLIRKETEMEKNDLEEVIKLYYTHNDLETIKKGAEFAFQNGIKKHAIVLYNKYFKNSLKDADEEMLLSLAEKEEDGGEFAKAFVLYSMAMNKNGNDYSSNIFSVIEKYEAIEDVGNLFIDLVIRKIFDFFDNHNHWTNLLDIDDIDSEVSINNILKLIKWKRKADYIDKYFEEIVEMRNSFYSNYFEKVIQLSSKKEVLKKEVDKICRKIIDEKIKKRNRYERYSVQAAACAEFAGFYEEAIELWIHSHYGKTEYLIRIGKKAGMTNEALVKLCSNKEGARNYGEDFNPKRGMRYAVKIAKKLGMKAKYIFYSIQLSFNIHKLNSNRGISIEEFAEINVELNKYKLIFQQLSIEDQKNVCWKLNALHFYFLPIFFGDYTFLQFFINIELRKLPTLEAIEICESNFEKDKLENQVFISICKFIWINEFDLAFDLAKKFNLIHKLVSIINSWQLTEKNLFDKIIQFYLKKGNFEETMNLVEKWNRWEKFPDITNQIISRYISEKRCLEAIDFIKKHNLESSYTITIKRKEV